MDQLKDMPDAEFYEHRRAVEAERERRERIAAIPEELATVVEEAIAAGLSKADVQQVVDEATA